MELTSLVARLDDYARSHPQHGAASLRAALLVSPS